MKLKSFSLIKSKCLLKSFIIIVFIVFLLPINNYYSHAKNIQDYGIISLMYHRFEENKYPSTNIRIQDFKSQIDLVKNSGIKFISHKEFSNN